MASAENLTGLLTQALRARDEARRLLASAEQLSGDESVAEEHREALKNEYAERAATSEVEVERLKSLIADRQVELADELSGLRKEESALEVRHKVGEFTVAQFRSATAELHRRMDSLSRLDTSLGALLQAETEADVRRAPRQTSSAAAVSRSPSRVSERVPETVPDESIETPAAAGGGLQRGIASASAVTPKWLLFGSLGLVVVGAIAVVVLFISAAAGGGGGFNLPNLPNLFQGSDNAPATPTSPVMPTREPTTSSTSALRRNSSAAGLCDR